jgi:ribosomal protein S18 acetylase RimI-like enzyme
MKVKPFEIDAAVMERIRPMAARDAEDVARLHRAAMGNSTWALLGSRFLKALYAALIDDDRFLAFVYEEDRKVRGFIAGSQDTDAMMTSTFRRMWPVLAWASLPRALSPTILARLVETHRYSTVSGGEGTAESLFCSFEANLRGKRISGHINKVLFDELLARGHRSVKITTETDNEGANRQLRSWGFEDSGRFTFYGKEMIRYVLDLEASERVQPVSRHPAI